MFRRINIDKENKLARESEAGFHKLVKDQKLLSQIHTITAVIAGAFLLYDLTLGHKYDGVFIGGAIVFILLNIFSRFSCHKRLKELHEIRETRIPS